VSKMESGVEGRLRRSRSLRYSKPETQPKAPVQKDKAGLREKTFDSHDNDDQEMSVNKDLPPLLQASSIA
jgi:hypothetical protein